MVDLPDTVYLAPFGTSGTYEQEVEIHLHPPRAAEAEARIWELQVVGQSKTYERQVAAAPLKLGIQPFEEFKTKLSPSARPGASGPATTSRSVIQRTRRSRWRSTRLTRTTSCPTRSHRRRWRSRPGSRCKRRCWSSRPSSAGSAGPKRNASRSSPRPAKQLTNPSPASTLDSPKAPSKRAGRARAVPAPRAPAGIPQALPGHRPPGAGRHQRRAYARPPRFKAGGADKERGSDEAQGPRRGRRAADPVDAQPGRLPPQGLAAVVGHAAHPLPHPACPRAVPVPAAQRGRPRDHRRQVRLRSRTEAHRRPDSNSPPPPSRRCPPQPRRAP